MESVSQAKGRHIDPPLLRTIGPPLLRTKVRFAIFEEIMRNRPKIHPTDAMELALKLAARVLDETSPS